jgi:hypothetical protein
MIWFAGVATPVALRLAIVAAICILIVYVYGTPD